MVRLRCLICLLIVALPLPANAQSNPAAISPINGLPVVEDPAENQYSFWVTGHIYGASQNVSGFPASTILGNMAIINGGSESFMVSTGDLFKNASIDIPLYERSFFETLSKPFFNAVGDHDVSGTDYQDHFGTTYHSFTYHGDLFLILDAEVDDGSIKGDQLRWFLNQLQTVDPGKAIFIFTHRPIWAENHPLLKDVFLANTRSLSDSNFVVDIEPVLNAQQRINPVYWLSGALGWAPASFFYHKEVNANIHYIQTAIRDLPRDAILRVGVSGGKVRFETVSLTGEELLPIEDYDLSFWQQERPKLPFYFRLIPTEFESVLTHRFFWFGALTMFGAILFGMAFKRLLS